MGQRRLAVVGRLVRFDIRQAQRKLAFRHRDIAALGTLDNWDRFAPVALAGKDPVAELIIDFGAAGPFFRQIFCDLFLGLFHGKAVEKAGINHDAFGTIGKRFFLDVAALYDFNNREAEFLSEIPVAGIVGRDGHNGARAVRHEDIIRNENRDLPPADGVNSAHAVQPDTGFVLGDLGALKIRFAGGLLPDRHGLRPYF